MISTVKCGINRLTCNVLCSIGVYSRVRLVVGVQTYPTLGLFDPHAFYDHVVDGLSDSALNCVSDCYTKSVTLRMKCQSKWSFFVTIELRIIPPSFKPFKHFTFSKCLYLIEKIGYEALSLQKITIGVVLVGNFVEIWLGEIESNLVKKFLKFHELDVLAHSYI